MFDALMFECISTLMQVLVQGDADLMGKMVTVEIYETGKHFMKGKIVQNSEVITPGLKMPLAKGEISGATLQKVSALFNH